LFLYRFKSTDEGTFGVIASNGYWWYTLELPYRDNKPNISCIPIGSYNVGMRYSPHFKRNVYHVKNVPNRNYILIHPANFAGDISKGWQTHLQGCITLGKKIGKALNKFGKKQECVLNSRIAIMELEEYLEEQPFKLIIEEL